jgi:putative solute:sodium symporter small subunit
MSDTPRHRLWAATSWLTAVLLAAWCLVSVLGPWFARDLNGWKFLGFPLGFWVVGQGALMAYLLIIVLYIVRMERIEARYWREREASACGGANADKPGAAPP